MDLGVVEQMCRGAAEGFDLQYRCILQALKTSSIYRPIKNSTTEHILLSREPQSICRSLVAVRTALDRLTQFASDPIWAYWHHHLGLLVRAVDRFL